MKDIYYTIHFEDKGTGECFDDFVFHTEDEAYSHWAYDYPGYGSLSVKAISREEAIDMLKAIIDERVEEWLHDDAVDLDPEDSLVDEKWLNEAESYIQNKEPGWMLLEEYIH